ncbi:MAG TPA: TetR/AcrR family transcriptional regulator [Acidimicrobiia bacterium]|nr:TetR/AcrR family transcriptional regulator [Acidimicrobiia bacterium]
MQNVVPLEERLADAAVAERRGQYAAEVRRLIDGAFSVMRDTGDIDPPVRDIVRAAGLSNQAFYRHFSSKDALLLAVLADGQRQLVAYLGARVESTPDPETRVRRWIEGVMAQAQNPSAAEATRPFAVNGTRLADRYPADLAASRAELLSTLEPSVRALGGTEQDARFVCDLALARMNDAIAYRRRPPVQEVQRLVEFCLAGVRHGT